MPPNSLSHRFRYTTPHSNDAFLSQLPSKLQGDRIENITFITYNFYYPLSVPCYLGSLLVLVPLQTANMSASTAIKHEESQILNTKLPSTPSQSPVVSSRPLVFFRLPPELRDQIWKELLPRPRIVKVRLKSWNPKYYAEVDPQPDAYTSFRIVQSKSNWDYDENWESDLGVSKFNGFFEVGNPPPSVLLHIC